MRLPRIPEKYFGEFVRGYFDGDGCIYFRILKFADRKKPRPIAMTVFTSGSRVFLEEFHAALRRHGVRGGALRTKTRGFDLSFSHQDSLALFRLMYDTCFVASIFLPRKYKKFRRAINRLYPDAAVV